MLWEYRMVWSGSIVPMKRYLLYTYMVGEDLLTSYVVVRLKILVRGQWVGVFHETVGRP